MSWLLLAIDWRESARANRPAAFASGRPVVCLGDSLTSGIGPERGYPAELAKLLTVPVIDLGREGFTSGDAIRELLPAALNAKPQAVIVELGGHDFLFSHSRDSLEANLRRIIQDCRASGAEVILIEVPRGFVSDRFAGIERHLARQYDLELVADSVIRKFVFWSPAAPPGMWLDRRHHLSDDGLHPNENGNKLLASEVLAPLRSLFGDAIVKPTR